MSSIVIALKDLQILFKDRGAVVLLFLLPLVFVVVFSGALAAIGGVEEEDSRIPLPVVNLDGAAASERLIEDLSDAGGLKLEIYSESQAMDLFEQAEIVRVLIIPVGFSSGLDQGEQVQLSLRSHQDADARKTEAVRLVIEGITRDMALESQIFASLRQMGEMQANNPTAASTFSIERSMEQARKQLESSEERPLIRLNQRLPLSPGEEPEPIPEGIQVTVSGFTVLFVFLIAQTTARSIYEEKKRGSFRRLLAAPLSKAALLSGKMLPNFLTALLQTLVIFAFGVFGMRLMGLTPLSLGDNPVLVVLIAVIVALCAVCLGVLIAAIARTENQIGGISSLLLWGMAVLGGSFIPLYFLERYLGSVTKIVPHYWANSAFNDVLVRGLGLEGVANELAVLLGFTALFIVVGLWRFDYD